MVELQQRDIFLLSKSLSVFVSEESKSCPMKRCCCYKYFSINKIKVIDSNKLTTYTDLIHNVIRQKRKGSYVCGIVPQAKTPCPPANKRIIYPIDSPILRRLLSTRGISCRGFTYLDDILPALKYGVQLSAFVPR